MVTLSVAHIAKRFGSVSALTDASFELRSGELLGLIGPNGAGKTTLLECTAGLVAADAGTVRLGDSTLATAHRKDALFYLPDGVQPWPDDRAGWVLEFAEGLFAAAPGSRDGLIASLRLAPILGKRVGALSKGERKPLSIALGLLTRQPLLLFDEPFDGLDLRQAREVAAVLRAHADSGRGLCLSIHQLTDAARICDRLVLLADGNTVGQGTLAQLREKAGVGNGGIEEVFLALT
jgi:ABC-2 type transport system ATP-binding protein